MAEIKRVHLRGLYSSEESLDEDRLNHYSSLPFNIFLRELERSPIVGEEYSFQGEHIVEIQDGSHKTKALINSGLSHFVIELHSEKRDSALPYIPRKIIDLPELPREEHLRI